MKGRKEGRKEGRKVDDPLGAGDYLVVAGQFLQGTGACLRLPRGGEGRGGFEREKRNGREEEEERFGTAVDTLGTLKKSSTYAFQPANFRGYLPHTWQPCVKCGQNCDWRTVLAVVPRRDNRGPNWPRLFTRLPGIVVRCECRVY